MWKEAPEVSDGMQQHFKKRRMAKSEMSMVIERSRGHAQITVHGLQIFDRQWNSKPALIPYRVLMSNFISTDASLTPTPLFYTAKCTSALKRNMQATREAGSSSALQHSFGKRCFSTRCLSASEDPKMLPWRTSFFLPQGRVKRKLNAEEESFLKSHLMRDTFLQTNMQRHDLNINRLYQFFSLSLRNSYLHSFS